MVIELFLRKQMQERKKKKKNERGLRNSVNNRTNISGSSLKINVHALTNDVLHIAVTEVSSVCSRQENGVTVCVKHVLSNYFLQLQRK